MHEECLGEKKIYICIFLKRKKLENTCARRALWEEGGVGDSVLISYFRVLARTPVQ